MARKSQHLRIIPGGREKTARKRKPNTGESTLDNLFSGRLGAKPRAKTRKKEQPPIELPKKLQELSDVFAAGRALEREVRLKADFARQRLEDFCFKDIAKQYAALNKRPPSRNFSSKHSRFKFVLTERTTLIPEKIEELHAMNIPIDEYTEVRGIQINYDSIRQHGLESKLRDALASMRVSSNVLEEIFTPQLQLKSSFYEMLAEVVKRSLGPGEELEDKLVATLDVLQPATQMRNVEVIGLNAKEIFDTVNEAEIELEDEIA